MTGQSHIVAQWPWAVRLIICLIRLVLKTVILVILFLIMLVTCMGFISYGDAMVTRPIPDRVFEEFVRDKGDKLVPLFDKISDDTYFSYDFATKEISHTTDEDNIALIREMAAIIATMRTGNLRSFSGGGGTWNITTLRSDWYPYPPAAEKSLKFFPWYAAQSLEDVCADPYLSYHCSDLKNYIPSEIDLDLGADVTRYLGNGWFLELHLRPTDVP